jgi:hypothetical protein
MSTPTKCLTIEEKKWIYRFYQTHKEKNKDPLFSGYISTTWITPYGTFDENKILSMFTPIQKIFYGVE